MKPDPNSLNAMLEEIERDGIPLDEYFLDESDDDEETELDES
jgi:hypothetical protein